MKWYGCLLIVVLMVLGVPCSVLAETESGARKTDDTHEFTMTAVQAMQLAGAMVERGDIENAEQILTKTPPMNNAALEIERWFLLAQIATRRGDIDSAIEIYRTILDAQPDLARIRFELAVCYMHQKKWSRADYHLRLAMAGDDLPENVRGLMNYYRYIIRQNKNWNVWFNFSAAPDNNINNAVGGQECVYGVFCRDLPDRRFRNVRVLQRRFPPSASADRPVCRIHIPGPRGPPGSKRRAMTRRKPMSPAPTHPRSLPAAAPSLFSAHTEGQKSTDRIRR